MNKNSPYIVQSELYIQFLGIGLKKFRKIKAFYEEHEIKIMALHFDEYLELFLSYVNSLFEIGEHEKFLLNVDEAIEISIARNITLYRGDDLYHKLLFRKAACLHNLMRFNEAKYILRELIKIQPWNDQSIMFLKKCNRSEKPAYVMNARAAGIFIFIVTAIVIAIEIFFIRQFYPEQVTIFMIIRNTTFLIGLGLLISGQAKHWWSVHKEVETFVNSQRKRKRELKREKTKVSNESI